MKFTKTAFRAALKANNQTEVWHLAAIKIGEKFMQKHNIKKNRRNTNGY